MNLSWLKKVGIILAQISSEALGLYPVVAPLIAKWTEKNPTAQLIVSDLTAAANEIVTIEAAMTAAFGPDQKMGSQKLKAATPFVAQIIKGAQFMVGKKIADEAKFEAAVTGITSNLADLLNSLGS